MFFVYVLLLFTSIALGSLGIANVCTDPATAAGWMNFAYVLAIIDLAWFLIAFFYQLGNYNYYRYTFQELKTALQARIIEEEEYANYKNDFAEFYNKLYPDYEKEIFKNMNPTDKSELSALLVKYPELQYSTAFRDFATSAASIWGAYRRKKSVSCSKKKP